MNLTVQQYLTGLERSVANLPGLLRRWPELDADLRDHFADELGWMADVHHQVVARAIREGRADFARRLIEAGSRLLEQRDLVERQVGVSLFLKHEAYSSAGIRSTAARAFDLLGFGAAMRVSVSTSGVSPVKSANDDGYVTDLDTSLAYAA